MRLLNQVVEPLTGIWGPDRMGVRLSPRGTFNDMEDHDPKRTFDLVASALYEYGLAYLHLVNLDVSALERGREPRPRALRMLDMIRKQFRGPLIIAGGFDHETAESRLQPGRPDLIAFGRKFHGGAAIGYIDYPTLAQERGEEPRLQIDERWRYRP